MKLPSTGIVKYHVKLKFEVDGLVEKADIIGAIFGQTEGLLGPEMNLNELQKVSKVGPLEVRFGLVGIDDIRAIKKKLIVDRAKKIVQEWATKTISEGEEMLKDVYDASKPGKLTAFGKAQLACGTGVFDSDWIILVEGRADVINLLRAGFDNAIAIEGAKIDETVTKLTEGKQVIAFLDGDRAGDLILKELQGLVKIDKILRAPVGREVEECTPLEIAEILKETTQYVAPSAQHSQSFQQMQQHSESKQTNKRDKQEQVTEIQQHQAQVVSNSSSSSVQQEEKPDILSAVREVYPKINETLEAVLLDSSMRTLLKIPVSDVVKKLNITEGATLLVLDGIVTQRLVEAADKAGIQYIVGHRTAELKKPTDVRVRTFGDMGIIN